MQFKRIEINIAEIVDQLIKCIIQRTDITLRKRWRGRQNSKNSQSIRDSQGVRGSRNDRGSRSSRGIWIEITRVEREQNIGQAANPVQD